LRPGWTKSWRCASAAALIACVGQPLLAVHSTLPAGTQASENRANELTLARLRPGQDTLASAQSHYGAHFRRVVPDSDDVLAWVDARGKRVLRLELRDDGVVESISLLHAEFVPELAAEGAEVLLPPAKMVTGRGLALGDPLVKVLRLYGPPASRGPATLAGREVEFLFYAFDWAGPDVPQVMEVTCARAGGRVVKITLAAASL